MSFDAVDRLERPRGVEREQHFACLRIECAQESIETPFDHRTIDGADAERFLSYVKEILEAGQFTV